ncbi:hypothetical protein V5O48_017265 [Marasmius crinis-equi]|uniref:Uncharacterized protein n=1 Tax=Marasmius crinis-equi TaxID=585013 RepID=A0ABR3EPG4_9AGAR
MSFPYDVNRDQNTGYPSDSSSSNSQDELSSSTSSDSSVGIVMENLDPNVFPPTLPLSFDVFFNDTDLQADMELPTHTPDDRSGDPVPGVRLTLLLWIQLILRHRNFYLRTGQDIRRPHVFYTQRASEIGTGTGLGNEAAIRTLDAQIWPANSTVRDRLDAAFYTIYGFLSSVGIHFSTNVPHATILQELNRVRVTRHLLAPEYQEFLRTTPGRIGMWAAVQMAQEPATIAYRQQASFEPAQNQQSFRSFREDSTPSTPHPETGYRRSSVPDTREPVVVTSRPRYASAPTLSSQGQAASVQSTPASGSRDKGKGRAVEPIPLPSSQVEQRPATSSSSTTSASREPAAAAPSTTRKPTVTITSREPANATPVATSDAANPATASASSSNVAPTTVPANATSSTSTRRPQRPPQPTTLPESLEPHGDVHAWSLAELRALAAEYHRTYTIHASGRSGWEKIAHVADEDGNNFDWKMPLEWYHRNRAYIDVWVDRGREIVVGRQLDRLVSEFRHNYLNLERDRTGNREIGVQTNKEIAPVTPTRPDVAEIGIQVSGIPGIERHTQTETGEYDSIFDEPPPVLDSILEVDEPEEESGIRNEAANPDQGKPLTP